jgi:glycosyltransferase involved in cell wall biosynthesis
MKKVLFIGVTKYGLEENSHLNSKFEGLSGGIKPYVLARGKITLGRKIWGAYFYLLPAGFLFWPIASMLAAYICLFKKIDVIVAQSPLIEGFLGTILKKIFRKELIVEIHGDWIEGPFLSRKRKLNFLYKKIVPFLAKFSFKNADKIRGVADYLIEEAKKIAPNKKYFLFPTFTDLSIFLSEKDIQFKPFILFVGYLQKVKGVKYLIEAFSNVVSEFPNFNLVVIGDGTEKEELEKLSLKLEISDKVIFKGRLSLEKTKDVMKDCYCFVLPSLSEGLPRVIIEAMALKKAVLASNVGGIPELVKNGEAGFLFEAKNIDDMTLRIKNMIKDPEETKRIGENNRKLVLNKFSNDNYFDSYIKMIEQ